MEEAMYNKMAEARRVLFGLRNEVAQNFSTGDMAILEPLLTAAKERANRYDSFARALADPFMQRNISDVAEDESNNGNFFHTSD